MEGEEEANSLCFINRHDIIKKFLALPCFLNFALNQKSL